LVIAIFLGVTLSRQITRPLVQLTGTAEKIAGGNFDVKAVVSSGDEVGTLAATFNNMTTRLGKAFEDVRRRALAVQTSAEVSRRLSTATSARQLAVEVVEQVQAAFHYYHAHIYFIDQETGDLVMAGGTGEAGATMLARGHKVTKGRGLVGRAAESNAPVLVPDVSKAEGWLPNPLLPETRSEAAIPITSGKTVLGVIDVQQNVVNGLGDEDVELLQSLAGQVAISYVNARTFEESRAKADLEAMVNAIGQKIQRTDSIEETLQTAIRELGVALGASSVKASIGRKNNEN
jgi:GAF domain-containing protein/HAMP domain-containing protein